MNKLKPITDWLEEDKLANVSTSTYWNNEEAEKYKEWNVSTTKDLKAQSYVRNTTNLEKSMHQAIEQAERIIGEKLHGTCVDLAAGCCWTTSILANQPKITEVCAVEISRHRLSKIAPIIFSQYECDLSKIRRAIGDFHNLKIPDKSVNIVVMSLAFHHSDHQDRLVSEIFRVLKPNGIFIAIGEDPLGTIDIATRILKKNAASILHTLRLARITEKLTRRKLHKPKHLFSYKWIQVKYRDEIKGDFEYSKSELIKLFNSHNMDVQFEKAHFRKNQRRASVTNFVAMKR